MFIEKMNELALTEKERAKCLQILKQTNSAQEFHETLSDFYYEFRENIDETQVIYNAIFTYFWSFSKANTKHGMDHKLAYEQEKLAYDIYNMFPGKELFAELFGPDLHNVRCDSMEELNTIKAAIFERYAKIFIKFDFKIIEGFSKFKCDQNFNRYISEDHSFFKIGQMKFKYNFLIDFFNVFSKDNIEHFNAELKKIDDYIKTAVDGKYPGLNFTTIAEYANCNWQIFDVNTIGNAEYKVRCFVESKFAEALRNADLDLIAACKEYIK